MRTEKSDAAKGWDALKKANRIDTAFFVNNHVYIFLDKYYYVYETPNQWSRRVGLTPHKIGLIKDIFVNKFSQPTMTGKSLFTQGSIHYCIQEQGLYQKVELTFNKEGLIETGNFGIFFSPPDYMPLPTDAALSFLKTTSHKVQNDPPYQNLKGSSVLFRRSRCLFTKDFSIDGDIGAVFKIMKPFSDRVDAALTTTESVGIPENPISFNRTFLFSGKYQVVMTNEKTNSEQDLAFWVPRSSVNTSQSKWMVCMKCKAFGDANNGIDGCSEGGMHDFQGSQFDIALNDPYTNGDIYWKRCESCHLLSRPGRCAKGGWHLYSNRANYNLKPTTLGTYVMCDKCDVLIDNGIQKYAKCPGGGHHKPVLWGTYDIQPLKTNNWKGVLRGEYKKGFTEFEGEQAKAFQSIEAQFKAEYPSPGSIRACYLPGSKTVVINAREFIDQSAKKPAAILQQDWDAVLEQLRLEMGKVINLNNLFSKIQSNILTTTVLEGNDLNNIINKLEAEIDPKDPPEVSPVSFLFGVFTAILGGIPVGEAAKKVLEFTKMIVELISESIELATEVGEHEDTPGENSFQLKLADLWTDLNKNFKKLSKYITTAQGLIVSDWGSLKAAHDIYMSNQGADLIFTDRDIMEKAYKIQTLRILLPLKYAIINIHENDYTYGEYPEGWMHDGHTKKDAQRAFKTVFLSSKLQHAVSVIPGQGISILVKKELFKKNKLGYDHKPTEEFLQWFPSRELMEWLTGNEENQYGINKSALIQGMMGWESIETRKAICEVQYHDFDRNLFFLKFGAYYVSMGKSSDPIEDLSSWKLF